MSRLGDLRYKSKENRFGARETILVGGFVEIGEGRQGGARQAQRSRGSRGERESPVELPSAVTAIVT